MSRISRFVVLMTAVASLVGVMSATAGAVTWHNTGSTAFTATTGAGTLSSTGTNLACTGGTATGAAPGGSTVGAIYNVTGTITYNGCFLVGQAVAITCGYTLTAISQPAANTATGNADVTCSLSVGGDPGTKLCHIEGAPHFIYANPGHRGTKGVLTVTTSTLTVTGSSCPAGANDIGHLSEASYTVTTTVPAGGNGPILTRTA